MSLISARKGVEVVINTEVFTNKQRSGQDPFRFAVTFEESSERKCRLDPAEQVVIDAPGAVKLIIIRSVVGKLRIVGTVDGQSQTMYAEPICLMTGVVLGDLTITNMDTTGSASKDVAIEWYV